MGEEKVLKDERKDEDENKEFVVMQGGKRQLRRKEENGMRNLHEIE